MVTHNDAIQNMADRVIKAKRRRDYGYMSIRTK